MSWNLTQDCLCHENWRSECGRLDTVFFGVVAEGAVGHFQGVGGAGANSAGAFHSGQEEGAFELLDIDFEIEAFGGKDGTVAVTIAVAIAVAVAGMIGDFLDRKSTRLNSSHDDIS